MTTIGLREVQGKPGACRSCGAPVKWAVTAKGRKICLELGARLETDGDELRVESKDVHFANCPNADQHRKPSAPSSAKLDHEAEIVRAKIERATQLAAAGVEALRRVLARARTADRSTLVAFIIDELQRLEGPTRDSVYPPSSTNRPRYSGD